MGKKFYRINQYIRAPRLRVIGEDGKQIDILTLSEALGKAQQAGLDLIEIAPTANPPVAKIANFKKFLYREEKKEREAKKKVRGGELKGIRLTPFIAKADLELRIKRAEKFLKNGNKVRVSVRFKGRQLGKKEFGYEILKRFIEILAQDAQPEGTPKWFGRELILTLSPVKSRKDEKETKNKEVISPKVQNNQNG